MTSGCFLAAAIRLRKPKPALMPLRWVGNLTLGGQFNAGWGAFFGIDGAGGETEKPVIYMAV